MPVHGASALFWISGKGRIAHCVVKQPNFPDLLAFGQNRGVNGGEQIASDNAGKASE